MNKRTESRDKQLTVWITTIALGIAWFSFFSFIYLSRIITVILFPYSEIVPLEGSVFAIGVSGFTMIVLGFIMLAKTSEKNDSNSS